MSEFSFPFTGGAGGQDGPYSASFFAEILENLFRQNPTSRADASVLLGSGNGTDNALQVTETSPASNNIEIKEGMALIQGYYYYNDSDLNLLVSPNTDGSGFDRIDIVALEIDFINQVVRAKIIEGTPAGAPVAPTLTKNASIYQVPIAEVEVANLFTTILNADIDNTVKVQGVVWETLQGGTGIEGGYVAGDILVSTGVDEIEKFSVSDLRVPVRSVGAPQEFVEGSITDSTASYTESFGVTSPNYAGATWSTIPFNNLNDDADIFTSLVAGVFTIDETGSYYLSNLEMGIYSSASPRYFLCRLYNITTATVLATGLPIQITTAGNYRPGYYSFLQDVQISVTASDQIAIQIFPQTIMSSGQAQSLTIDGVSRDEFYGWVSFRKVL